MKNIMQTVRQAKEEKQRKKMAAADQKTRSEQVSTVATFNPSQRKTSTRHDNASARERVPVLERVAKSAPKPLEAEARRNLALSSQTFASRSAGSIKDARVSTKKPPSPTKPLSSPTNTVTSPLYASVSPSSKTSSMAAANVRPLPPAPATLKSHPFSEKLSSASTSAAEIGSVEYVSRLQHPDKRFGEEPWVNGRGGEADKLECSPSLRHRSSPTGAGTTTVLSVTASSPPPIIPPYNPALPDRFPLSNKEEYVLQYKKQIHSYEDVDVKSAPRFQPNVPASLESNFLSSVVDSARGGPSLEVQVRRSKKRDLGEAKRMDGHVGEGRGTGRGGAGRFDEEVTEKEMADLTIADLAFLPMACAGLPTSCKADNCLNLCVYILLYHTRHYLVWRLLLLRSKNTDFCLVCYMQWWNVSWVTSTIIMKRCDPVQSWKCLR